MDQGNGEEVGTGPGPKTKVRVRVTTKPRPRGESGAQRGSDGDAPSPTAPALYLLGIRRRWKLVLAVFLVFLAWSLVRTLRTPNTYTAATTLFTPRESQSSLLTGLRFGTSLGGQLFGNLLPTISSSQDVFVAILRSRTMARDVAERFMQHFSVRAPEDAVPLVRGMTVVEAGREGTITIRVEFTDAKLAADIANFYPENLDRIFTRLGTTEASHNRVFISRRRAETEKALRSAEDALRSFQEKNKAVVLPAQSQDAIVSAAKLKAQIMAAEVQLEVMKTFATESNPDVITVKNRIAEMKRQLARMQYGKGWDLPSESTNPGESRQEIFVAPVKLPGVAMEFARLIREVKIQEAMFALLTQQLEQAKISEARDLPAVKVLDKAVPPRGKSGPSLRMNLLVGASLGLLLGVILAFAVEHARDVKTWWDKTGTRNELGGK